MAKESSEEDSFSDPVTDIDQEEEKPMSRRAALECLVKERKLGKERARHAARVAGGLHTQVIGSSSSSEEEQDDVEADETPWLKKDVGRRGTKRQKQDFVQYQNGYYDDGYDDGGASSGMEDFIATSSSESSDDIREQVQQVDGWYSAECKRHRGRKKHALMVHSSSDGGTTPNEKSESEDEIVLTPSSHRKTRDEQQKNRVLRRTPRARVTRQSPIDRIRKAQEELMDDDQQSIISRDDVSSMSRSKEEISLLTDEGDPGTTDSSSPSSPQSVPRRDPPKAWELEVQKLGIHKLTEEDYLQAYIEYLFICSVDPSYEQTVKESDAHASLYSAAIRKIEYMIFSAQDAVHSEIWRKCDPYLLEALEQHEIVRLESPAQDDPPLDAKECAACGKYNGQKVIIFEGKLEKGGMIAGEMDADMMLSQKYALASPIYQKNRQHIMEQAYDELDEPPTTFHVGSVCGHRLAVFHRLFHFRHHCVKYLTLQAKKQGTAMDKNAIVDAVLHAGAHAKIRTCFTSMIGIAESYNIQGGEEEDAKKPMRMGGPSLLDLPSLQGELAGHQGPLSPIRFIDESIESSSGDDLD